MIAHPSVLRQPTSAAAVTIPCTERRGQRSVVLGCAALHKQAETDMRFSLSATLAYEVEQFAAPFGSCKIEPPRVRIDGRGPAEPGLTVQAVSLSTA